MENDIAYGLMMMGLGFLLGFKIAARMGDRHLERMEKIWRGDVIA